MMDVQAAAETEFKQTEVGLIPVDWELVPLRDTADYLNGAAFKPSDWGDAGLPIVRIQNLTGTSDKFNYFAGEKNSRYRIADGDLLISWSASLGAFLWQGGDAWLNQHIFKVDNLSPNVDKLFLYFAVQHHIELLTSQTRGTTMKHIVRKSFLETEIPLPPFPEQRRIAAVLNAIQDAIAAQDDVIAEARALKRSLMQRLFTYGPGREPAETKETEIGEIPAHWEAGTIGQLASVITSTSSLKSAYKHQSAHPGTLELLFLKVSDLNIPANRDHVVTARTSLSIDKDSLGLLMTVPPNSVVFPKRGGAIGTNKKRLTAMYCLLDPNLIAVVPSSSVLPRFLYAWLLAFDLTSISDKTTIPQLNKKDVQEVILPLPPLAEQEVIVGMLRGADEKIAVEEDRKAALQDLFKSTLHQLMAGQMRLLSDARLPI